MKSKFEDRPGTVGVGLCYSSKRYRYHSRSRVCRMVYFTRLEKDYSPAFPLMNIVRAPLETIPGINTGNRGWLIRRSYQGDLGEQRESFEDQLLCGNVET